MQPPTLLIVVAILCLAVSGDNVFRIGSIYPESGGLKQDSIDSRDGQELWLEEVNRRGGFLINNETYKVEIIFKPIEPTANASTAAALELVNDYDVDFFILPLSIDYGLPAAIVGHDHKINSIEPATGVPSLLICDENIEYPCESSFGRRLPYTIELIIPTLSFMGEALNILTIQGTKRIAVYWEPALIGIALGAMRDINFLKLDLVYQKQISSRFDLESQENDLRQMISDLIEIKPDVLVGGTWNSCSALLRLSRELGFNPKAFLLSIPCLVIPELVQATIGADAQYVMVAGSIFDERLSSEIYEEVDPDVRYHHFISNGTSLPSGRQFVKKFKDRYGREPRHHGTSGYTMGYIIQYAVEKANSMDPDKIQSAIDTMDMRGFSGEFQVDRFGQNAGRNVLTYQLDKDLNYEIVAPLFAATKSVVYPVPRWDQRQTTYGWYLHTSERIIGAIVGAVILLTIGLIIFVIIARNNIVIRASQPLFVVLMLCGTILMYSSVFFWSLHTNDLHCNVFRWLLAIGFGLTYGALFARVYRIGQIFLVKSLEVFRVTNAKILPIIGIILAIEVVILALWTIVSRGKGTLQIENEYVLSDDFYSCQNTKADIIFVSILGVVNVCVLIYGIYWVIRIWKLRSLLYNESKLIGLAVYILNFFVDLFAVIQLFGPSNRELLYILRSLCIILGPLSSVLVLLIPKLFYMTKDEDSMTDNSYGSHTTSNMNFKSETPVISQMRSRIEALETQVAKLKQKVATAEESSSSDEDDTENGKVISCIDESHSASSKKAPEKTSSRRRKSSQKEKSDKTEESKYTNESLCDKV